MGARKQYSSINFHGGLTEGISLILITNVHDLCRINPRLDLFADWPEKSFLWPISGTNSKISGTGSVRVSSQGLFCRSNKPAAPGSPRMPSHRIRHKDVLTRHLETSTFVAKNVFPGDHHVNIFYGC